MFFLSFSFPSLQCRCHIGLQSLLQNMCWSFVIIIVCAMIKRGDFVFEVALSSLFILLFLYGSSAFSADSPMDSLSHAIIFPLCQSWTSYEESLGMRLIFLLYSTLGVILSFNLSIYLFFIYFFYLFIFLLGLSLNSVSIFNHDPWCNCLCPVSLPSCPSAFFLEEGSPEEVAVQFNLFSISFS